MQQLLFNFNAEADPASPERAAIFAFPIEMRMAAGLATIMHPLSKRERALHWKSVCRRLHWSRQADGLTTEQILAEQVRLREAVHAHLAKLPARQDAEIIELSRWDRRPDDQQDRQGVCA